MQHGKLLPEGDIFGEKGFFGFEDIGDGMSRDGK